MGRINVMSSTSIHARFNQAQQRMTVALAMSLHAESSMISL